MHFQTSFVALVLRFPKDNPLSPTIAFTRWSYRINPNHQVVLHGRNCVLSCDCYTQNRRQHLRKAF